MLELIEAVETDRDSQESRQLLPKKEMSQHGPLSHIKNGK